MAYLDHAASTPVLQEVRDAVMDAMGLIGNPSSAHAAGRRARRLVEESREAVAAALGARPSEVLLTGSGTESDNLAVKGLWWARREQDARRTRVLASAVEHHAVLDAVQWLADHEGALVTWVPVDGSGRVDEDAFAEALGDGSDVALATVMWANNEVGTVQPVEALATLTHERGVPFHTDAVQAVGQLPVDLGALPVDALTMTGHKLGGPQGVGALLLRREASCTPLLHGGGQERDVRSGTVDVASAAGLAVAVSLAEQRRSEQSRRLAGLRDDLVARVRAAVPGSVLNGAQGGTGRLPGNAHFSFPGCEGDSLLMLLDAQDVHCSTGSACSAGVSRPSHVLVAMGSDHGSSALRFSLGHTSTAADVDALVRVLPGVVARARSVPRR